MPKQKNRVFRRRSGRSGWGEKDRLSGRSLLGILAEGAIAQSMTLCGGVLFAS